MNRKNNLDKKKKRVVVAMSGGVDSSVAAYLLKKQGFDVVGIFLKFWTPPEDRCGKARENACCNLDSLAIARQIAERLDISFYVIHAEEYFKKEIVDNFILEYERGLTPNPCVRCNRYIKFGFLWEKARALGADYLATGHYVKTGQFPHKCGKIPNPNDQCPIKSKKLKSQENQKLGHSDLGLQWALGLGHSDFSICRSKDEKKDQTYFLSSIDPAVIPHLLFPLGNLVKSEVRAIAKKAKLPVYSRKDSMGVCFIPDGDNANFLANYSKKLSKKGDIVDKKGNILGRHKGLIGYTIGEKIGGEISNSKFLISNKISNIQYPISDSDSITIPRLYVLSIDTAKNRLIVGENADCFSDIMQVKDLNIINPRFWELVRKKKTLYAQIRGGHKPEKAVLFPLNPKTQIPNSKRITNYELPITNCLVKFSSPVRAITPGQTVAFYDKDVLLGGGIIIK